MNDGGIRLLDELMANAWRPLVEETHGGWRYRWANGMTRRANSVLALWADREVSELVERAESFYRERGAPTLIQVSTASAPEDLATYLHARDYRSTARTLIQAAASRDVVERTRPTLEVEITSAATTDWFRMYWSVEAIRAGTDAAVSVYRDVLLDPRLPTVFATARSAGAVVGVGQLVIERSWGGVQCMTTDPSYRRRGVAQTVLGSLAEEAMKRGAGQMYLAVVADNDAATALYAAAGFKTAHEYSYFTDQPD